MSLSDEQWLFLKDVSKLIAFAAQHEYKLTGEWLFRNEEVQRKLVNEGLSKTMNSYHLKKLAIDLNVFFQGRLLSGKKDWNEIKFLGDYWESLNEKNRWGGDWNMNDKPDGFIDSFHFERRS